MCLENLLRTVVGFSGLLEPAIGFLFQKSPPIKDFVRGSASTRRILLVRVHLRALHLKETSDTFFQIDQRRRFRIRRIEADNAAIVPVQIDGRSVGHAVQRRAMISKAIRTGSFARSDR